MKNYSSLSETSRYANPVRTVAQRISTGVVTLALVAGISPFMGLAGQAMADETDTATSQTQTQNNSSDETSNTSGKDASNEQGNTNEGNTPPAMPDGQAPSGQSGQGGPGGADTMNFDYSGTYTGTVVADNEEVQASGEQNATDMDANVGLAQNGGILTLKGATLSKSGDDTDGDRCNFYGANSIVLAVGEGSQAIVSGTQLNATSEGSNGLFATDSGTVWSNDNEISTSAGNSRGLDATYGGVIVANETNIETQGDHCAGVATDRGGGEISVTNSTISTAGSGSPIIYSTGDIEISNVQGTATGSQLVGMEGKNSVLIEDSTLSSTTTDKTASDPIADGIIIYQSTSGDAEASTGDAASFTAVDSTLSSAIESGSMFYLTNTQAHVVLQNTVLDFDDNAANLLVAAGNDSNNWGRAGSNGANVVFTGIDQELAGDVESDTISSIDLYLTQDSTWTGAACITENTGSSSSESQSEQGSASEDQETNNTQQNEAMQSQGTGQMPDNQNGSNSGGTPPEMPNGEQGGPADNGGTPPEPPSGEAPSGDMGTPPAMPDGQGGPAGDGSTPPEPPSGEAPNGEASSGDMGTPPAMPNEQTDNNQNQTANNSANNAASGEQNQSDEAAVEASDPITINVDATSTWVVTEDSTISNLNVAEGGSVVDQDGKTVSIVADGKSVVEGESSITVTVNGTYSTTVETTDVNKADTGNIDRSDFDTHFGTNTQFIGDANTANSNASDQAQQTSDNTTDTAESASMADDTQNDTQDDSFLSWLWNALKGLFGK